MTNNRKLEILDAAIERGYAALESAADVGTGDFKQLLSNIGDMEWMADRYRYPEEQVTGVVEAREQPVPAPVPTPAPEPTPEPEPVGEPEPPAAAADVPQYKMTDVRAALAKARGKGVNVSEIISSFGAANFQQITEAQYPAIMQALAEKGAV